MWRAVFYFVQVGTLVALAVWLSDNPGKVEINWLGYRVETYFGVLLLVACVVAVFIALAYHLWRGLLGAPGDFMKRRQFKRREEGYRALALGMAAAAAGDREESQRLARRADSMLQDPDLTRLLSAQAATLNGDQVAARRYFDALVENDETAFLGLTGLMRQAAADGDDETLLHLAERAHKVRPDSAFVVDTLFNLQSRGALWSEAQATLFDAVRRQVKTEAQAIGHRTAIFTARAFEAEASARFEDASALAEKALSTTPDFVPAALVRADMLRRDGKNRQAIRLLEGLWHRNPHPDLALAYLRLWPLETGRNRLKRIQTLTAENPTAVESRLALAFAALQANLWGEARRNLTAIGSDEISARVCRLMARLEQDEHGDTSGAREWLDRADGASQDKAWTCGSCGAVATEWSALCGNCGRFDTALWKRPPRVSVLPLLASTDTILNEEFKVVEDVGDPGDMVLEEVASPPVARQAS